MFICPLLTGKCLDRSDLLHKVFISDCDTSKTTQKWEMNNIVAVWRLSSTHKENHWELGEEQVDCMRTRTHQETHPYYEFTDTSSWYCPFKEIMFWYEPLSVSLKILNITSFNPKPLVGAVGSHSHALYRHIDTPDGRRRTGLCGAWSCWSSESPQHWTEDMLGAISVFHCGFVYTVSLCWFFLGSQVFSKPLHWFLKLITSALTIEQSHSY